MTGAGNGDNSAPAAAPDQPAPAGAQDWPAPAGAPDQPAPATAAHAAALAAIHAAAFQDDPWSEAAIATLFENPTTFGFIAPAGGLVLARAVAGEAEILTIGVAATARRRGIARALLGAALAEARGRGAETVFLEVAADNDAAIRLYRACLFRPAGRRRDYYGPGRDALLFTRPLS